MFPIFSIVLFNMRVNVDPFLVMNLMVIFVDIRMFVYSGGKMNYPLFRPWLSPCQHHWVVSWQTRQPAHHRFFFFNLEELAMAQLQE